ncbi:MAG: tRNA (adenosine(37)-N6)-threonylcarbamoyltransferase complex dimerization subunit type 1 TsaB [Rhodovarius sp.]|nr:tRNA (adenosine(37)-N6)-threonylcarbamoyltransferase complex dimerization subunit type 1 TsaB [Rhodovarius sp.]MDW8314379.1 tRNA (adenosine(37)-N6)-threonylcarbamoyltransferase complex dimerization subunit type 1 TsaB [Rhodovarius sp.]
MRLLALESAGPRCSAALLEDDRVLAHAAAASPRGHAVLLPVLAARVLGDGAIDRVAVGVGPGGFTGLRAGLALALGIAAGRGVPVIGVSTGDALAALTDAPPGWAVWAAIDNKRGLLFLERPGADPIACAEAALPAPEGPVVVVGDAAPRAAARLLARGARVMLGEARLADAIGVGRAALRAPRPPVPIYVDPPAVT